MFFSFLCNVLLSSQRIQKCYNKWKMPKLFLSDMPHICRLPNPDCCVTAGYFEKSATNPFCWILTTSLYCHFQLRWQRTLLQNHKGSIQEDSWIIGLNGCRIVLCIRFVLGSKKCPGIHISLWIFHQKKWSFTSKQWVIIWKTKFRLSKQIYHCMMYYSIIFTSKNQPKFQMQNLQCILQTTCCEQLIEDHSYIHALPLNAFFNQY